MRIIVITIFLCNISQASKVWDIGTSIEEGTIITPLSGDSFLCGSSVNFSCYRGKDYDHWCDPSTGTEGIELDEMSSSFPKWIANAGSWKYGDYRGTSVEWLTPNYETTSVVIDMNENDKPYSIPWGESGTRNDPEALRHYRSNIRAIKPSLYTATYGGGNHAISDLGTPEYSVPDSRTGGTAAWTMGANALVNANFSCSSNLSQAESGVKVRAETSGDEYNIGDWGDSSTATWSTTWPCPSMTCVSEAAIDDDVQYHDYSAQWKYKCTDGTNTWISITNQTGCRLYVVWDTPWNSLSYKSKVYEASCTYCWGCDKGILDPEDEEDICDFVLDGIDNNYTYDYDCYQVSSDFSYLIGVQGVSSTQQRWSAIPPYVSGDLDLMKSVGINAVPTASGGDVEYEWWYHWWVTAVGKTFDPSSATKYDGSWTDYEDDVFAKYRDYDTSTWIDNYPGQTSNQQNTLTPGNPSPEPYRGPVSP